MTFKRTARPDIKTTIGPANVCLGMAKIAKDSFALLNTRLLFTYCGMMTGKGMLRNLHVWECEFDGRGDQDGRKAWGMRMYDVADAVIESCFFHNIHPTVGEHGTYLNTVGSVTWENCTFHEIGGQAIQVVFRDNESADPAWRSNPGLLLVRNCLVKECGLPGNGRASFALTFFPTGQNVEILDTRVINEESGPHPYSGGTANSYGGILIQRRPQALVLGSLVRYRRPDRELMRIQDVQDVNVDGCEFDGGKVRINNCANVDVVRCTGSAELWVNGKKIGPISQPYRH